MAQIGIVVPLFNEERTAAPVAERLVQVLGESGLDFRVALVADGSTDGTRAAIEAVARTEPRVTAVCGSLAEGYGAAILRGFSLLDAEVVGWMDGDGQVPPETVVEIFRAMKRDQALVGTGIRKDRADGWLRRLSSWGYNWTMRRSLGVRFPDINAKPKLVDRRLLRELAPSSKDWFIDTEIVAGALIRNVKVVRVPVPFLARQHGSTKVGLSIVRQYRRNLRAFRRRSQALPAPPSFDVGGVGHPTRPMIETRLPPPEAQGQAGRAEDD